MLTDASWGGGRVCVLPVFFSEKSFFSSSFEQVVSVELRMRSVDVVSPHLPVVQQDGCTWWVFL